MTASADGAIADGGVFVLDQPSNRQALSLMVGFIHRETISPPNTFTQMKEEEVREVFQNGQALFERNWPYAWPLHQAEGSPVAGKTGIAPLPHFPDGVPAATLGGWHVGISKYSDRPEEAHRLVRFIVSDAVQKELALRLGWNPGRSGVYRDPAVLQWLPYLGTLREIFDNAVARPVLPYYNQVSQVVQRHLNAALAGWVSPEESLRQGQEEIEAVTARYRVH